MTLSACPDGHLSSTDDYCDVCGIPLSNAQSGLVVAAPAGQPPPADLKAVCANCGAAIDGRFCEECGQDSAQPPAAAAPTPALVQTPPPTPNSGEGSAPIQVGWSAVVRVDFQWFREVRRRDGPDVGGLVFPGAFPERRFPLNGTRLTIGRGSRSRNIHPDIDLSGPPADPGVSALHAMLVALPDNRGWQILDLNSTNGTTVGEVSLVPNTPVTLADGDEIKLGAWSTIVLVPLP